MPRRLAHFSDPRLDAQIGELIKKHRELQKDIEQLERRLQKPIGLPDAMPPTEHEHGVADITDFPEAMPPTAHKASHAGGSDALTPADIGAATSDHTHDFSGVPDTRKITAGNGLTGGGDLSADRAIAMGTPSTITATTSNSVTSTSHTHALSGISRMAAGSYVGDGVTDRPISVGFQPKLVISAAVGQADLITSLSTSGGYTANTSWEPRLALTTSGFTVGSGPNRNGNKADVTYTWIAFA